MPVNRTPHRQLLLENLTDKSSSTGVKCNHARSVQLDYGSLVAKCLTMQTIASCTGRGRFMDPYCSASPENLLYYCLYGFDLVSLALGEMNGGELLPRVVSWLFADRTD